MAPYGAAVWAIEIGSDSLKALRLGAAGQGVVVLGFANIVYGKILAGSGVSATERDELIALGLRRLLRENSIAKDRVIVSVPSQTSFARFVNLPPVEEKKIPQVVRLEAGMQIPFDMSEVQWDWQLMSEPGVGQARVGIFAIKSEVVAKELEYFGNEDVPVSTVQMVPMALYNYLEYDRPDLVNKEKEAAAVLNIGTEATDLVVCGKSTVWQRCIPMGGNSFTRAIADAFKLNFEKAEKLKRTAAMSKYARQVFQAMRPVFTDFASEVQRSLGFFSSSQPDCKVTGVIALGGGTRLRGLLKYLGQTLQLPIEKPDAFKRLVVGDGVSAAQFGQSVVEFAVVYGLGLQGLGQARIDSNLLPRAVASSMALASKAKYFTFAAAALLLTVALGIGRTVYDSAKYEAQRDVRQRIANVIRDAEDAERKLSAEESREDSSKQVISTAYKPLEYREVIPEVVETVLSVLPNKQNNPSQAALYDAFDRGDVAAVRQIPRTDRKQVFVTAMTVDYSGDLTMTSLGGRPVGGGARATGMEAAVEADRDGMAPEMHIQGMSLSMGQPSDAGAAEAAVPERCGFVVTLMGYTPYRNIGELMDPVGVHDDPNRWGVVTRLQILGALADANSPYLNAVADPNSPYLNALADPNSPFELFGKTQIEHFELQTGQVGVGEPMPAGVGMRKSPADGQIPAGEDVLIDPMTKEVISKVVLKDEMGREKLDNRGRKVYEVNDHWFVLKFKLRWREAPGVDTAQVSE